MESLTALRMPKMEVSASCRSLAPSQLLLYFSISCRQTHNKHAAHRNGLRTETPLTVDRRSTVSTVPLEAADIW